jgi:DNA-binding PadR family transcriptional regulator
MVRRMSTQQQDLLPLTPAVFHILLSLAAEAKHGYAIMKEVAEQTEGELRLGPGKLYYSIQRMLEEGLIEEIPDEKHANSRRPYRITAAGRAAARAEAQRLHRTLRLAAERRLIED